jgi:hypothetical protein
MVTLTPQAFLLMDAATDSIFASALVLATNSAIAPLRWWNSTHCLNKLRRTNGTLRRYALVFRDTAIPLYAPVAA